MSDVIRSFLVRIGYQESGRKEFEAGLKGVTGQIAELAISAKGAALAVQAAVATIASGLEELYWLSNRANASAEGIKAIGFAATQVGGSVDAMRGSVENLGRFLRINPGAENFIASLGVQTRDANGELLKTDKLLVGVVRNLQGRQPAVALALAGTLGIDEKTLLGAGGKEFADQQAEYDRMQKRAHYNVDRATEDAHSFMVALRTLGAAIGILQEKVGSAFTRSMGEEINRFRIWLVDNFDRIAVAVEWTANKLLEVGRIVTDFGRGLWGLVLDAKKTFDALDPETKRGAEIIGVVTGAILLFNAAFRASPIGLIVALGAAVAALVIDYREWKYEGKESPIDWAKWEPVILDAIKGFKAISKEVLALVKAVQDLIAAFTDMAGIDLGDTFSPSGLQHSLDEMVRVITAPLKYLKGVVRFYAALARGDLTGAVAAAQEIKDDLFGAGQEGASEGFSWMPGSGLAVRLGRSIGNGIGSLLGIGPNPSNAVVHPGAASAIPKDNTAKMALAQESFDFWKSRGFTDEGAATMVAAEQRESGFNIAARGDKNSRGEMTAHGSFQWHPDRRKAILERTGIDVSTASHAEQLRAAALEAELGLDPQWAAAYGRARGGDTNTAADAVTNGMLRPADRQGAMAHDAATGRAWLPLLRPGYNPNVPAPGSVAPSVADMERLRGLPPGSLTPTVAPLGVGPQSSISNDNSSAFAMNQNNNIVVNVDGGGDPHAIGRSVLEAQQRLAQQAARDMRTRMG